MSQLPASGFDIAGSGGKIHRLANEIERLNELRQQVILQEQKVQKLHISEESDSDAVIGSLIRIKEREIALALMRVAELTRQLEQLKLGQLDQNILSDSTSGNAQLLDQKPELVRSIIGPLSTTSPRVKSVPTVVNSVTSGPIQQSSVAETDKGRYNSLPMPSRARDLVRNAVLARNKSKEAVDCNDNLVALKVPSVTNVIKALPVTNSQCSDLRSLSQPSLVNCKSSESEKSCADVKNKSDSLQQETSKQTYNKSVLSQKNVVALVNGSSEKNTPPTFNDKETNVACVSESGSNAAAIVKSPEVTSVLPASGSAKSGIDEQTEKLFSEVESASSKTDVEQERKIADCIQETKSSHDSFVGGMCPDQNSPSTLTCSETTLNNSIPLQTNKRHSENAPEVNNKTPCSQPNLSAMQTLISPSSESIVTSAQSSAVAADDVDSALLVLKSNSSSSSRSQPRLSGSAANRYNSISSRMYGNRFEHSADQSIVITSSLTMLNSPKVPVSSSDPVFGEKPVPEPNTDGFLPAEDSVAVEVKDLIGSESSSDDSFDSDEEDVRDFRDSEEDSTDEAGNEDSTNKDAENFRHNDSFATRELKHWHFRAVASPPPRRYPFHKPDDTVCMKASAEIDSDDNAEQCANVQRVSKRSRRVTFDPFTLSLNAALEGELETLQATFAQLDNPNKTNEDGLSVLHNAVCSGCLDVLEYLIDNGCDVNIADSDGWTPLHCAASSNNLEAVRLLVEHGASLMALSWYPEYETPLQKCAPDSPGFAECVLYITEMLDRIGSANDASVYAVADYTAVNTDEMSFKAGDQLVIVRQGDESEPLWWWARNPDGVEGYIPPNLVAFYKQSARSTVETSC